jgi:tRNA A37 threonylcarbamoyladenosine synthetase subunit TsaC/SUA5/YrdC
MDGRVDLIIDAGPVEGRGATTVDLTAPDWKIIKTGAITEEQVADCLSDI